MFTLSQAGADIFVPDGTPLHSALAHTKYLGVGAHQDDLEFMALYPILKALGRLQERSGGFCGVTVTSGSGSARGGAFVNYTDDEMIEVRREEQRKAASMGRYVAMLQLDHPSAHVKDPTNVSVIDDLEMILLRVRPEEIYTHNVADKHPTHVGVLLKLVAAIRRLPAEVRPKKLIGCEVWRSLDWLPDSTKVIMDVSGNDDFAMDLMRIFQSQIEGGKRYDLAEEGRRRANATMLDSHAVDTMRSVIFGMDMTACIDERNILPEVLYKHLWASAHDEVMVQLNALGGK